MGKELPGRKAERVGVARIRAEPVRCPAEDRPMQRTAAVIALGALAILGGCNSAAAPEDTKCTGEANKVGMTSWASTTIAPGATYEVATNAAVCNGQCPVTGQKWTATPTWGSVSGTLRVTYGAHCGPNTSGDYSNDQIGTCQLLFNSATPLTDASLAESHDADCVQLWAGVNPTDPGLTQPCGKGSTLNFRPYVTFFNNATFSVTISGPGPASNPTAECVYASGT